MRLKDRTIFKVICSITLLLVFSSILLLLIKETKISKHIITTQTISIAETDTNGIVWNYTLATIDEIEYATNIYYSSGELGSTLTIPGYLTDGENTYPVYSIGNHPTNYYNITNTKYSDQNEVTEVILPDTLKEIGNYAFYNFSFLHTIRTNTNTSSTDIELPSSLISIGNSAFLGCRSLTGTLKLPSNLQTIRNSAFRQCSNINGSLVIPDSVTTLEAQAFSNCSSLNERVIVGNNLTVFQNYIFSGCQNIPEIVFKGAVTSINNYVFNNCSSLKNIYINNLISNISISSNSGISSNMNIHYSDCLHTLTSSLPAGVHLIDPNSQELINLENLPCLNTLSAKLSIDGDCDLDVNNLKLFYGNSIRLPNENGIYNFEITQNQDLQIREIKTGMDLVLKQYISKINFTSTDRILTPFSNNINTEYRCSKTPLVALPNDLVTYTIRIYNEGTQDGEAREITSYLPEGLEFVEDNELNIEFGWEKSSNSVIKTNYLSGKSINGVTTLATLDYKDINVVLKVTKQPIDYIDQRLVNISEISQATILDPDSTPNNIILPEDFSTYKQDESISSTSTSYITCDEDDMDFENLVIQRNILVDYQIEVNKLDLDTNGFLDGATFNLLDENKNILKENVSATDGTLNFGTFTAKEEGSTIYYIVEKNSPIGYSVLYSKEIKIIVNTILNNKNRTFDLNISSEFSDVILEKEVENAFIPIYTREQLAKIGSSENIEIDDDFYSFSAEANYKLMNDIDLNNANWTPIQNKITGIFDGNSHKITNLRIVEAESSITEIGLFRVFSGTIKDLALENVDINIQGISSNASTITQTNCVGGIVGYLDGCILKNCSVSGNIISKIDNVGGLIGFASDKKVLCMSNCTNFTDITVIGSNVGGLVGASYSFTNIDNCTNYGNIAGSLNHLGGFIGYAEPIGDTSSQIQSGIDKTNNTIIINIYNEKISDSYEIELRKTDSITTNLIDGAVFSIYNENKELIEGLEEVSVINGILNIGTINITGTGTDIFYIKEISSPNKYKKIVNDEYIRILIQKIWDSENQKFSISIVGNKITPEDFENEQPIEDDIISQTPEIIFNISEYETITWESNKVRIINSSNEGIITSVNFLGGIIGKIEGKLTIENCKNNAEIIRIMSNQVFGHTGGIVGFVYGEVYANNCINNCAIEGNMSDLGGIIGRITKFNDNSTSRLINCTNIATLTCGGNLGENVGGIVGLSNSIISFDNCNNSGTLTRNGSNGSCGGIIGSTNLSITVERSSNAGNLSSSGSTISIGGIIGSASNTNSSFETNRTIKIHNCLNVGDFNVNGNYSNTAGILGFVFENNSNSIAVIDISDCKVPNSTISVFGTGNSGGIIGYIYSYAYQINLSINNCDIKHCNISSTSSNAAGVLGGIYADQDQGNMFVAVGDCNIVNCSINATSGNSAGIIGTMLIFDTLPENVLSIKNCNVLDSTLYSIGSESRATGGILGVVYFGGYLNIDKCNVDNSSVTAAYSDAGGIIGTAYGIHYNLNCSITNTNVNNSNITSIIGPNYKSAGGLIANTTYCDSVSLNNCNVFRSTIKAVGPNDSFVSAIDIDVAGLLACDYGSSISIINCDVEECHLSNNAVAEGWGKSSIGGIMGHMGQYGEYFQFINCNVLNSTITYEPSNSWVNIGGIIATVWETDKILLYENCTVENTSIIADIEYNANNSCIGGIVGCNYNSSDGKTYLNNCKVINSTEAEIKIKGNSSNLGGLIGFATCSGELYITNCDVANMFLENTSTLSSINTGTSGFVGTLYGPAAYENCSLTNTTIISSSHNTSGFGGSDNVGGTKLKDCFIDNCTIISKSDGTVGGFLGGGSYGNGIDFDNCHITETLITDIYRDENNNIISTGAIDAGGFITGATGATEKCKIKNSSISDSDFEIMGNTNGGSVGAISGSMNLKEISNCNVTNVNITSDLLSIGGIAGYTYSQCNINNCNVTNVNITYNNTKNTAPRHIGGLANGSLDVNDTILDNITILAKSNTENGGAALIHVGGFAGITNTFKSTNNSILNSNITNNSNSTSSTGGIIGLYSSYRSSDTPINDISVQNTKISNSCGYIGGIVGFTNANIENCSVTDSSITSTSDTAYGVGGIIGHGNNISSANFDISEITDCSINGCTISGKDAVGGIAGAATPLITRCTVTQFTDSGNTKNTTINGNQYIGGLIGYGGELLSPDYEALNINSNELIGIDIIGITDVNKDIGKGTIDTAETGKTDIINLITANNITINGINQ